MVKKIGLMAGLTWLVAVIVVDTPVKAITEPLKPGLPRRVQSQVSGRGSVDDYRLGAGDRVRLTIYDSPDLSGDFEVLPDGALSLPLAGSVPVQGMTLDQATAAVTNRLQRVLRYPIVTISMQQRRPVRVAISGEVSRPGVYTTEQGTVAPGQMTLTRLLRQAGGITAMADLRSVTLSRNGESRSINLWALLNQTDLSQDPILLDGDQIQIPMATALKPEELRSLSTASFAPDAMPVNVVGEVARPGAVSIAPNTPLNQAILAAGGFNDRSDASQVELLRLEPDGTVSKKTIMVNLAAAPNPQDNPPLRPNDTVIVAKNGFSAASDAMRTIFAPLGALSPASILLPFLPR